MADSPGSSYYDPPDGRHCPDCADCDGDDAYCNWRDHRFCAWHYAESREEAAERKWDEEHGK